MFGLDYIIFRPHNVFGSRQNIGDKYRNVVGIFMNQILQGEPMTIFGNGNQTRVQWNNKFQRLPGFVARAVSKGYLKQFRKGYLEPLSRMLQEESDQTEPLAVEPAESVVVAAEGG